jgi:carboxyl-terminal processing protease
MGILRNKIVIIVCIVLAGVAFTSGYFVGDIETEQTETQEVEELLYEAVDKLLDIEYEDPQRTYIIEAAVEGIMASSENDFVWYEILYEIAGDHYSQTEKLDLIQGAIEGMIGTLDDPFTRYFDAEEANQYQSNFGETYVGIGITVRFEDTQIVVDVVKSGGPADQAGLHVGDVITHVDGELITDNSFYDTINKILGEEGTEVVVGVYRPGYQSTLFFPMTRAVIDNSSVEYELFEQEGQKIGYIIVSQFGDETSVKFQVAIQNLENQGMDSLIVDLRDNGGGHLSAVYNMLNEFLIDDGNPMFTTDYYRDNELGATLYIASNTERKSYNIVTLVNENSASASEVFASSMSEHGGYPVIGMKTYGKGTMQTTFPVTSTEGDYLHLTIGRWLTANGSWVHYDGGTDGYLPDVEVEQTAIEKAYKVFLLGGAPILYDTVDVRVANVQIILNMMGYTVRTDGYYDMDTKLAIEDIQTINTLTVTGNMDQDTLEVINETLQTYLSNSDNDTQLQASIDYLLVHPEDPNE